MTEQQIEELIQKYANGTADKEETRKLMDWYQHAFRETEWLSPDPQEKEKVHDRMLRRLQAETGSGKGRVISFPWLKAAAIVILFLSVAAWLVFFQPFSPSYVTATNPSQKIQLIRLPDNSEVWLNANSTLRYSKKFQKDRHLQLTGEAHFKVTHNPAHPFVVDAGDIRTTVLGTSFTVKAYASAAVTSVSVTSGRVKVDHDKKELAVLTPAQQLRYDRTNQDFNLASIDTNIVTSWTKGRLQF
jgi:transmembrane sensor